MSTFLHRVCFLCLNCCYLFIFSLLSDLFSLHYRLTFSFFRILLSVHVILILVIPAPRCVFLHPASRKNLMLYFPPLCTSLYTNAITGITSSMHHSSRSRFPVRRTVLLLVGRLLHSYSVGLVLMASSTGASEQVCISI